MVKLVRSWAPFITRNSGTDEFENWLAGTEGSWFGVRYGRGWGGVGALPWLGSPCPSAWAPKSMRAERGQSITQTLKTAQLSWPTSSKCFPRLHANTRLFRNHSKYIFHRTLIPGSCGHVSEA